MRQLLTGSLRLINAVGANETPSSGDMDISLQAMNGLIDSMSNDLLNVYTFSPYRFPLVAGQKEYTLGPAFDADGNATNVDWVIPRPMRIEQAKTLLYAAVTQSTGDNAGVAVNNATPTTILSYFDTTVPAFLAQYQTFVLDTTIGQYDWGIWDASSAGTALTVDGVGALSTGTGSVHSLYQGAGWPSLVCVEFTIGSTVPTVGLFPSGATWDSNANFAGSTEAITYQADGTIVGKSSYTETGDTFAAGDVIGIVVQQFSGGYGDSKVAFFKNGVAQGNTWLTQLNSLYDVFPFVTYA
jgi:hypothetical protein